jgi:hypothetical protein
MILLIAFVSVALVAVIAVTVLRFVSRKLGIEKLVQDGVIMTASGIEFPRFVLMGRSKASYDEIESVEFVPFPKNLLLRMRYGSSVSARVGAGSCRGTVVVKLRSPRILQSQYHLFEPGDPVAFAKELKSRIERGQSSQGDG